MARYTGPVCRLCRRAGEKLMLKGNRCATPKCAMERRSSPPGSRSSTGRRPKISERGLQLREKQKARNVYGILEGKFRWYFAAAKKASGITGENLVQILERRLDNAVYRLGFASSRAEARQTVRHGHITVNGRKVDIPSYLVKPGDILAWREKSMETELHKQAVEQMQGGFLPSWLSLNRENLSGQVLTLPTHEEVDTRFDVQAIVEYYSR